MNHRWGKHVCQTTCADKHLGGSRVLEAVIHYPPNHIPGSDKSSYRHHRSDASTREVEADLSRFSNEMPSPDNPGTAVAPFPHVLLLYKSESGEDMKERIRCGWGGRGSKKLWKAGGEWESVNINTKWKWWRAIRALAAPPTFTGS